MTETEFFLPALPSNFHTEIMSVLRNRKPFYQKRNEAFKTVNAEVYCWIVPFYSECGHFGGRSRGGLISLQKKWGVG